MLQFSGMGKKQKRQIPAKSKDISAWYRAVVREAELADYAPVRGTMVFRPWGYALWEKVQESLDKKIKAMGVDNAYFPIFIPMSLLEKEKTHVEGFSPELAVVTHGGGEKLAEPLAVRPTSETIMYAMFSKWITSWRELPLKVNQWCNVVRWEKRTFPFLRTAEFLWQEGHTAHATHEEAEKQVREALAAYEAEFHDYLALWGITGWKSETEKFAGGLKTTTYEVMMPDGKSLQAATSHDLGQNFAKAFEVKFQDKEGKMKYVWQTSWGLSTRALGGLIMVHGDDDGLFLPPKMAPVQVVIVPIYQDETKEAVLAEAKQVKTELEKKFRVKLDDRDSYSPGWKFNYWEVKGVPLRLEIGPKDIEKNQVVLVRRDILEKMVVERSELAKVIQVTLASQQEEALARSKKMTEEQTRVVDDYAKFKEIMATKRGFIRAYWCGKPECEAKIKAETKATTRCLPFDEPHQKGKCIYCGKPAEQRWYFAQAY